MTQKGDTSYIKRIYTGRLNRRNFIKGLLFVNIPFVLLFLLFWFSEIAKFMFAIEITDSSGAVVSSGDGFGGVPPLLFMLIGLFAFCFMVAVSPSLLIRRHYDMNQSWKYFVVITVMLVGLTVIDPMLASLSTSAYMLYLLFKRGDSAKNGYGETDSPRGYLQIVGLKP